MELYLKQVLFSLSGAIIWINKNVAPTGLGPHHYSHIYHNNGPLGLRLKADFY